MDLMVSITFVCLLTEKITSLIAPSSRTLCDKTVRNERHDVDDVDGATGVGDGGCDINRSGDSFDVDE